MGRAPCGWSWALSASGGTATDPGAGADASRYVVVVVAAGDAAEADRLARMVVQRRLAACAQRLPVHSCYRWRGEVETADEHLVLFKTRASRYRELETAILEAHSYDVPEILAFPVEAGLASYLEWIDSST